MILMNGIIAKLLARHNMADLKRGSGIISKAFKENARVNWGLLESTAFVGAQMLRSYTIINAILRQLEIKPASMLDFCSGPGTAIWYFYIIQGRQGAIRPAANYRN